MRDLSWEEVHLHRDPVSGLVAVVAINDLRLGPARGGTRLRRYPSLEAAVEDATRLGRAMTLKFAVHGLPFSGGKGVILQDDAGEADRELLESRLRAYGRFLDRLGGAFGTGPDFGIGQREVSVMASASKHVVHGAVLSDATVATAMGVRICLEQGIAHTLGGGLEGRSVAIQGVGSVGAELARDLAQRGARVLIADQDGARAEALAAEIGGSASVVDPGQVLFEEVDALAPCATGEVLDDEVISRLACKVVAGAANNQLAGDERAQAEALARRGILFVPDFVVSGGAAVVLVGCSAGGEAVPLPEAEAKLTATVSEILGRAAGTTPYAAARALAEERIQARRAIEGAHSSA